MILLVCALYRFGIERSMKKLINVCLAFACLLAVTSCVTETERTHASNRKANSAPVTAQLSDTATAKYAAND